MEGENRVIGHLQKDMYVADNPYILPLITGTLGDTGYVGAVQQGTCRMCTLPMSGAHVMKCAVYRLLHSFEVNRLFRCALHEVHFVPNKRPPKSEWQELLVQHALDTRAIMADNLGKEYYVKCLMEVGPGISAMWYLTRLYYDMPVPTLLSNALIVSLRLPEPLNPLDVNLLIVSSNFCTIMSAGVRCLGMVAVVKGRMVSMSHTKMAAIHGFGGDLGSP